MLFKAKDSYTMIYRWICVEYTCKFCAATSCSQYEKAILIPDDWSGFVAKMVILMLLPILLRHIYSNVEKIPHNHFPL